MSNEEEKTGIILCSCASNEEASRIGRALVESSLAACCTIIPTVQSIYRWKDELCDSQESLMLIKTSLTLFAQCEHMIRSLHSYEVPEIVSLAMTDIHGPYKEWLLAQLSGSDKRLQTNS